MDQVRQNTCGVNVGGILINNLRFADDIDLVDEDIDSLRRQIEETKNAAEQAGLLLNTTKTKIMASGERNIDDSIEVAGETIENVERFEYLGSLLTWDNDCSEDIKRRIGKATDVLASLKHIWNSKKLKIDNKLRVLTTCVISVLLYASETWTLKETDTKKTTGVRNEMLSTDSENQLERHDTKRRYPKQDIQTENHSRHDQEKKTRIIRSHLQNGR
ncbi:unnamed protein product [Adineta ricciae]|uniref:Reverse transcriptase domain-containing protein n=1 Tax=Adineta ricciae TaxID=249248 RepID=A0A816EX31_ADIRI|nr:unnamed protein product [Adineta ricciae]CAF1653054.1 unnamed protein product [Adineta ricciae]